MEALTNIGGKENFIFGETAEGVLVSICSYSFHLAFVLTISISHAAAGLLQRLT